MGGVGIVYFFDAKAFVAFVCLGLSSEIHGSRMKDVQIGPSFDHAAQSVGLPQTGNFHEGIEETIESRDCNALESPVQSLDSSEILSLQFTALYKSLAVLKPSGSEVANPEFNTLTFWSSITAIMDTSDAIIASTAVALLPC